METTPSSRHTCVKLETSGEGEGEEGAAIFVKGTWFDSHFCLSITDGLNAWLCLATEQEVRERAEQWDQEVGEYIRSAEHHLAFQHPLSTYRFSDAGSGYKRLSWSFEKEGMKLEWRWKCRPSPDSKKTSCEIMDFLMDANIRLSEEVVAKTKSWERMKVEADKCLAQSERFCSEKTEFETAVYEKFLAVLNSKKTKLRDLRDQLSKKGPVKVPQEEESTDKTESYDEGSDEANSGEEHSYKQTGDHAPSSSSRGRGRKRSTLK